MTDFDTGTINSVVRGLWPRYSITDEVSRRILEWFRDVPIEAVTQAIRAFFDSEPDSYGPKWADIRKVASKARQSSGIDNTWTWADENTLCHNMNLYYRMMKSGRITPEQFTPEYVIEHTTYKRPTWRQRLLAKIEIAKGMLKTSMENHTDRAAGLRHQIEEYEIELGRTR